MWLDHHVFSFFIFHHISVYLVYFFWSLNVALEMLKYIYLCTNFQKMPGASRKLKVNLIFFSAIRYDKVVQKHNFLDLQVGSSPNLVYHHAWLTPGTRILSVLPQPSPFPASARKYFIYKIYVCNILVKLKYTYVLWLVKFMKGMCGGFFIQLY